MKLDNIQKMIYEVEILIKSDGGIRNLLYYTTADALTKTQVDIATINDYIFCSPVFETTIEPYNKASFITISLAKLQPIEDTLYDGVLRINILSQLNIWEINNQKIRPLEIANRVIEKIDNVKLSHSHTLVFEGIDLAVLDKNISGYAILFSINEGSGLENEF